MQAPEFLRTLQYYSGVTDPAEALTACQATLETLAERLKGGEPRHLSAQLPPEIGSFLHGDRAGSGEHFDVDEFIHRVSRREGVDEQTATAHARAVIQTLGEAVSPGEMQDVRAQLPPNFQRLFGDIGQPIRH